MSSTKSETTLNDAEKAVQARQDETESSNQQQYQILADKCTYYNYIFYLHLFLVHERIL
jgi:hypothetical protein